MSALPRAEVPSVANSVGRLQKQVFSESFRLFREKSGPPPPFPSLLSLVSLKFSFLCGGVFQDTNERLFFYRKTSYKQWEFPVLSHGVGFVFAPYRSLGKFSQ